MRHTLSPRLAATLAFALLGTAANADALADFQAAVDKAWDGAALQTGAVGTSNAGSVPLLPGKSIGAACLGSQITACVQWWAELQQIAALTGWTVTEYDGKLDVVTWNEQLARAAEAGHDGILTFGAIPVMSGQGLGAIAAKGLPVVGMASGDPEGVPTFATLLDGGIQKDNYEIGYLQGVAAYKLGNGKLHAIGSYDGAEVAIARRDGFEAFIAECVAAGGDCKANLRQADTAQMFQQIPQFCSSLALANPGFNVLVTVVDDATAMCVDEVRAAGLLPEGAFGVGVDFNSIGVTRVSEGTSFLGSVAAPYASGAWQGIDELNRIMSGQAPSTDRLWLKGIFHPGNIGSIDTASGVVWDVQLFNPAAVYGEVWGLK